jgi:hypothetical protein
MIQPERSSPGDPSRQAHNIFADPGKISKSDFRRSFGRSQPEAPGQPFPERVASNTLDPPVDIGIETQVQRQLPSNRATAGKYMTLRKFCEKPA